MYHIKSDLRAQRSSEQMFQGLLRCMEKKNFDKISISDVTKESSVSRATFYRNFDSMIDILYWKCNQLFNQVLTDYCRQACDNDKHESLVCYVFRFWIERSHMIEVLLSGGRSDIIYNSFYNNGSIVLDYLNKKYNGKQAPGRDRMRDYKYFLAICTGIFVGVFQVWIENGKQENAQELTKMVEEQYAVVAEGTDIF
ncbi:MAG: TetR/AcrR family transcriptional regulator [Lachnospiraceae bacterium]|jgi:AcrR family transcriptional regulator